MEIVQGFQKRWWRDDRCEFVMSLEQVEQLAKLENGAVASLLDVTSYQMFAVVSAVEYLKQSTGIPKRGWKQYGG